MFCVCNFEDRFEIWVLKVDESPSGKSLRVTENENWTHQAIGFNISVYKDTNYCDLYHLTCIISII